mmetsp:Transcript_9553/g.13354  ORF Transcript_9553/g.13354 Transcript_9553/m.13354 type:complete len:84 (-) Transcript_9553:411-662(-)|eukprot:CAMPEP_0184478496 /NCGR_PEP_ID=MMETSP0113_2-20130426/510_1 /TAXON_ID=91329 /ORGANISM="Norrisiella sphaerica, Strain BC52" /LENGTH=83 /DNA_ID=CAMNT_0026856307 /DNA_START=1113 /DNA_END=1364 /DNA_ORIENTATION=-
MRALGNRKVMDEDPWREYLDPYNPNKRKKTNDSPPYPSSSGKQQHDRDPSEDLNEHDFSIVILNLLNAAVLFNVRRREGELVF